jgi:hypothetical protein
MATSKQGISFPTQGLVYQRETTNGYYNPTSIPAAIQQKKNQAKVLRSIKKAKDGMNIPQSSTRAKEPVQSAAFKSGYCSYKKNK